MDAVCSTLDPILQIHPTRRCNLRCLHCYSHSDPEERDILSCELLMGVIADAREQGYLTVSFSGGEPTLYRPLGDLLRLAKSLGMRTTVTSNGMLLREARLAMLAGYTDVLAISLDGVPESHNRMRDHPGAFEVMANNLDVVRASGIDFGFIFTLTQFNVHEADWAARFAVSQGAKLFQIHPLEGVGRALDVLPGACPDAVELAYAFIEAERIRQTYGDRLCVQLDIFHRDLVARVPEQFYADGDGERLHATLAACVTPLVLEAEGMLVPYGYGFARKYALGDIRHTPLKDLAAPWMATVYPKFRALCRRVYQEACLPSDLPLFNWYEMIQARSLESANVVSAEDIVNLGSERKH
jgi:MoaA/NifB/PqqE/SkfB family radical SAM enzyme